MSARSATRLQWDCGCASADVSPSERVRPPEVIQELVQHFRVCWVTLPEVILVEHGKHRVGFLLELQTTHEHREKDSAKDCGHCQRARAVLRIVADCIVRYANRPCACAVEIQTPFVTVATRGNLGVLKSALRVVHRNECEQPENGCEARWLKEMQERLNALGATDAGPQANAVRPEKDPPLAKAAVSTVD